MRHEDTSKKSCIALGREINRRLARQDVANCRAPERAAVKSAVARRHLPCAAVLLSVVSFVCLPAAAEPYLGQFELKTLESAPGSFEFQSQNAWSWDHSSRRFAGEDEDIVFDENAAVHARHALELETGFSNVLKMRIGVEFEQERIDQPATIAQANAFDELRFSEVGAEIIAVLRPREGNGAGLGLVAELEGPWDQEDPNHLVLGGIFEFQADRWFIAAVPTLVHAFGGDTEDGERRDDKWDFAYAAEIAYTFSEYWSLALEGYGTVERLGNTGHRSNAAELFGDFNQHRLGPAVYYQHHLGASSDKEERAGISIGFGLLEGMNHNTASHTLKLSIEVDF